MAASTVLQLLVLAVSGHIIFLHHVQVVSCLHVEIFPTVINELINDVVSVKCIANDSPYWTASVVIIEIGKKDEHPLAILRNNKLQLSAGLKHNMLADGNINEVNITQSFLRIKIKNPELKDAGIYVCRMFYMDGYGDLKEGKAEANMTFDNNNDKVVLVHLLKQLSDLENELKGEQDKTNALENKLKEQQDKTNVLEKTVSQQEKQLEDQRTNDTVTIAFSYAYNANDKLVSRQPLLFRDKIMSIGDAYDPKSGVFTAPRDGLYMFHLTVGTKNDYIYIDLEANGKWLARLYVVDGDYYDQGSVSSVTSLKAGDRVQPVVYSFSTTNNNVAWGASFSTFSGYLVKLL